jgi:hypothetical protein
VNCRPPNFDRTGFTTKIKNRNGMSTPVGIVLSTSEVV